MTGGLLSTSHSELESCLVGDWERGRIAGGLGGWYHYGLGETEVFMEVSSQRLAIVQHRHPPARGLLSLISLLRAFSLTGINRNSVLFVAVLCAPLFVRRSSQCAWFSRDAGALPAKGHARPLGDLAFPWRARERPASSRGRVPVDPQNDPRIPWRSAVSLASSTSNHVVLA